MNARNILAIVLLAIAILVTYMFESKKDEIVINPITKICRSDKHDIVLNNMCLELKMSKITCLKGGYCDGIYIIENNILNYYKQKKK